MAYIRWPICDIYLSSFITGEFHMLVVISGEFRKLGVITSEFRMLAAITIRGHKGQSSAGNRCRGFLVMKSRCRGFLSSEKSSWNHDVVAYLSPFVLLYCFSPRTSMSRFFGLGISMLWFFSLGILMSWYMCLHGLFFVIIAKRKKSRIIMSIMLLKNISIAQIYATSICIMCISKLE